MHATILSSTKIQLNKIKNISFFSLSKTIIFILHFLFSSVFLGTWYVKQVLKKKKRKKSRKKQCLSHLSLFLCSPKVSCIITVFCVIKLLSEQNIFFLILKLTVLKIKDVFSSFFGSLKKNFFFRYGSSDLLNSYKPSSYSSSSYTPYHHTTSTYTPKRSTSYGSGKKKVFLFLY